MSSEKERIGFIATARCIGILLVVFGHSIPFQRSVPGILSELIAFIYTFHMPLFLFISGYLLTRGTGSIKQYIRKRGLRLLIPYFVLSVAAFIPKVLLQQYLNDTVEFSLWYLVRSELVPRENVWGHFWYLPVVFFLGCAGSVLREPMRRNPVLRWSMPAIAYLMLFLPGTTGWFALEDLRSTAFYFLLGMAAAFRDGEKGGKYSRCWLPALPGAIALFALFDTTLTDSLAACLMIGFVLHLGTRFPLKQGNLLSAIESCSFSIFLLSWPAQAMVEVVCNRILGLPLLPVMGLMFLAGIAVPLACVKTVILLEKRMPMNRLKRVIGM